MIFFITLFRYFTIVLFFTSHFFSFSQGMQTRERAHCARSVFPVIKKKKKKKILPGFLRNLQRLVSQADPRLRVLARQAPLVLTRLRSIRLVLLPRVSLARGRRRVKVRLPFPLPPEAPAALEERVKVPGKSQPDGVTLPVRVGG